MHLQQSLPFVGILSSHGFHRSREELVTIVVCEISGAPVVFNFMSPATHMYLLFPLSRARRELNLLFIAQAYWRNKHTGQRLPRAVSPTGVIARSTPRKRFRCHTLVGLRVLQTAISTGDSLSPSLARRSVPGKWLTRRSGSAPTCGCGRAHRLP